MKTRYLLLALAFLICVGGSHAQSTLIHYWNFNTLLASYNNPNIPPFDADYSVIDTSKAQILYVLEPGTSSTYAGYIDNVAGGDLLNLRLGADAGQAFRVRNPSDSMELHFNIPTTGYKNITMKYVLESSGTTSGQLVQLFDYSVDGGTTWKTSADGMTVNGASVDTLDVTPDEYQGANWGLVTITFGNDTTVNNNPNLVVRIKFRGNTTGAKGNNRFDDVTVEGDPAAPLTLTLIHYWNFNTLLASYNNPNIPPFDADYSVIDTSKAQILYVLEPGTSSTYAGYIDNVAGGDLLNLRLGADAGQAFRVRNPSDSMELHFKIPTTGFKNIVMKYVLESSSTTSGQLVQLFDYSVDGGTTWKTSADGLTVNGASVDTLDVTPDEYQGANWGLVTITFGNDTTVNNNPNLVVRIKFRGNTTGAKGNNRFDDVTVEGVGNGGGSTPATITLDKPSGGAILVVGRHAIISFTTFGSVTAARTVEYSADGGNAWHSVGALTGTSTLDWIVPSTPTLDALVRVTDGNNIVATSAPFTIYALDKATDTLVHYWDFNGLQHHYNNPDIPSIAADFSAPDAPGSIVYVRESGVSDSYAGYIDNVAGSTLNTRLGAEAGQGLRVRNPTDSMELRFYIPTTGYKNIALNYDLQSSDPVDAPLAQHFDYSVDSGATWKTDGLSITLDSVTQPQYQQATAFGLVSLNFGAQTDVNNNPRLVFRIKFTGSTNLTSGNNRFDNFTVDGTPLSTSLVAEQAAAPSACVLYPNPSNDHVTINTLLDGMKMLSIVDITGRVVYATQAAQRDVVVNTSRLVPGVYSLVITPANGGERQSISFVKP